MKVLSLLWTLCVLSPLVTASNDTQIQLNQVGAVYDDVLDHFQPDVQSRVFPWPDSAWINHNSMFAQVRQPPRPLLTNNSLANHTSTCFSDLVKIVMQLKKGHDIPQWLVSMLDATGKPPAGVLRGAMTWPGKLILISVLCMINEPTALPGYFRECQEIRASASEGLGHALRGQYCSMQWFVNVNASYEVPISHGMCVPDSCSNDLFEHINALKDLLKWMPQLRPLLEHLELRNVYCHPQPDDPSRKLDGPAIACLTVIGIFVLLALLGTSMHYFYNKMALVREYKTLIDDTSPSSSAELGDGDTINSGGVEVHVEDEHVLIRNNLSRAAQAPIVIEAAKSFSLMDNLSRLLDVNPARREISCVHGIRFLSMSWIILGHTYVFPILQIENLLDAFKDIDTLPFYTVMNGSFSVDSFFVLSGFLLSYLFYSEYRRADGERTSGFWFWVMFYVHRIWRLTPLYAIVLWIDASVAHYVSSGPYWDYGDQPNSENVLCAASWWRNLLYVNNFQNITSQCMAWSWYLANDMQFHVISPIFLVALQ